MRQWNGLILAGAALSLGACDWITGGRDDEAQPGNDAVSAEGKAEAGQVSVKAPGLDVTFTVPKSLTRDVKVRNDIATLYPKASITGMYAAGGGATKKEETEVEFRFVSTDPPDRIAAWYREPARSPAFKLKKVESEGAEMVIHGSEQDKSFKVRLAARAGGGTDGRLVIHDTH
jgi:hypothetical protein